jgi:hypothetical protein
MDLDCEVFFPFFPGTFLDLPVGILYTIIVSLGPDTLSVVTLEFLGYHFGSDLRTFGSSF